MYCPKCGTPNVDNASVCVSCGYDLATIRPVGVPAQVGPGVPVQVGPVSPVQVRMSAMAIVSFILAILSLFT